MEFVQCPRQSFNSSLAARGIPVSATLRINEPLRSNVMNSLAVPLGADFTLASGEGDVRSFLEGARAK